MEKSNIKLPEKNEGFKIPEPRTRQTTNIKVSEKLSDEVPSQRMSGIED